MANQQRTRLIQNTVHCAAWSANRVALAADDRTLHVFSAKGTALWRKRQHIGPIEALAWSPNGRLLASASEDGVRLWSRDGNELANLVGHDAVVSCLAWSPGGQVLASGSEDQTIRLWSIEDQTELKRFEECTSPFWSLAWAPNGRCLASGSEDPRIFLWSPTNGQVLGYLTGHSRRVEHLVWSPDSRRLVSCGRDQTMRLWSVATGSEIRRLEGPAGNVSSVVWSPTGNTLAIGSPKGEVWFLEDPKSAMQCLTGRMGNIREMAWSADSSQLFSITRDGTLALLETGKKSPLSKTSEADLWISRQVATLGRRSFPWAPRLNNATNNGLGLIIGDATLSGAPCFSISPDGRKLASGHLDGGLRCWDLTEGKLLWKDPVHSQDLDPKQAVHAIAWSPDDDFIAVGRENGEVSLWSTDDGIDLHRLVGHRGAVATLVWSPDGQTLASGAADRTIRLWSAETAREVRCLRGHEDLIRSVAWSPDGKNLASGSQDGTVRLWSSEEGRTLSVFEGHAACVYSLSWAPDGSFLASGSQDKSVRLWSFRPGVSHRRLNGHAAAVLDVAWSPDGRVLVSGSLDGTLRIWEPNGPSPVLRRFNAEEGYAWRLAWAKGGHFLASSHAQDTIRIWEVRDLFPCKKSVSSLSSTLPTSLIALHHLSIGLPLSWIRDVRTLLGGIVPPNGWASFRKTPSWGKIQLLQSLHWPTPSRVGLMAILFQGFSGHTWSPPEGTNLRDVRRSLKESLGRGESLTPTNIPPPFDFLEKSTETIDDSLITLLEILGPEAVAADPSLALQPSRGLPALTPPQRRLLRYPITPLRVNGHPYLRPTILVIGGLPDQESINLLRSSASAVVHALRRKRLPVAWVDDEIQTFSKPSDLVSLFSNTTLGLKEPMELLKRASTLQLEYYWRKSVILLLTHASWAGGNRSSLPKRLRTLWVKSSEKTPIWTAWCEREEYLLPDQYSKAPAALGRLLS